LHAAIQHWWTLRSAVNDRLLQRLDEVERLSGFSGKRGIGVREGEMVGAMAPNLVLSISCQAPEDAEAEGHQDCAYNMDQITKFIESITDV
jgi:hypothetical protein